MRFLLVIFLGLSAWAFSQNTQHHASSLSGYAYIPGYFFDQKIDYKNFQGKDITFYEHDSEISLEFKGDTLQEIFVDIQVSPYFIGKLQNIEVDSSDHKYHLIRCEGVASRRSFCDNSKHNVECLLAFKKEQKDQLLFIIEKSFSKLFNSDLLIIYFTEAFVKELDPE